MKIGRRDQVTSGDGKQKDVEERKCSTHRHPFQLKSLPSLAAATSKRALGTPSGNSMIARSKIFSVSSFQMEAMILAWMMVLGRLSEGSWPISNLVDENSRYLMNDASTW